MDVGLLILRLVVGLLFVGHGTQKLFGWFGGGGVEGTGAHFETLGYRPGPTFAGLAGLSEAVGGVLLAFGLFTPIAAMMIIGVMTNAIVSVHLRNGLWVQNGGAEYPLVLMAVASALAFVGPGAWSVDQALGVSPSGTLAGMAGSIAGIAAGLLVASGRRRPSRGAAATRQEERRAA
jgi:putative oxidoreductase